MLNCVHTFCFYELSYEFFILSAPVFGSTLVHPLVVLGGSPCMVNLALLAVCLGRFWCVPAGTGALGSRFVFHESLVPSVWPPCGPGTELAFVPCSGAVSSPDALQKPRWTL